MMMRAILIDPVTRSITETEVKPDDWRDACRVLGCESIESAGQLDGNIMESWHGVVCDGKALLDEEHPPTHYFEINTAHGWTYPIGSKGLITGHFSDRTAPATLTIDEVRARVRFTERRFRGLRELKPREIDHPIFGKTVQFGFEPIMPLVDPTDDEK
jgi:hypothetical protein